MLLRELREDEKDLLKEFLYQAIYIPEGIKPPDKSIIEKPELVLYYQNFGSEDADYCIVSEENGKVVGAVWTRIMDDYGHIDDDTPSLSISLLPDFRSRGYGRAMMKAILELLKEKGYEKVSLSVQKENYAVKMYQSLGFQIWDDRDEEYIMIREL